MKDGWLSIDSAPKDGSRLLAYIPDEGEGDIVILWWNKDALLWPKGKGAWATDDSGRFPCFPSHWQPLEPPE